MHLVNVKTMKLESFAESDTPKYAILSHRWQDGEVLFQDMQPGHDATPKAGYAKLAAFCAKAAAAGYGYAWCDTCCIDKSSSAELSESINSMFKWYRDAGVCFAYLYDVEASEVHDDDSESLRSEWFTRGWCLQELVAPREVIFFNARWEPLGSRGTLSRLIHEITGIDADVPEGASLSRFSVAQRMAWAADRKTTRGEDVAYSLLGIFGVNMPLLYGEGGERAFRRLQEEIIRQSPDQSILVHSHTGLFARSPADFRDSARIVCTGAPLIGEPYNLTNAGLSVSLLLFPWAYETYLALLDCHEDGCSDYVGIFVQLRRRGSSWFKTDHAMRVSVDGALWLKKPRIDGLPRSVCKLYIESLVGLAALLPPQRYGFWVRRFERVWSSKQEQMDETEAGSEERTWAVSANQWNDKERFVLLPNGRHGTAGIVARQSGDGHPMLLRLGFSFDFRPILELGGEDYTMFDSKPGGIVVDIKGPNSFPINERLTRKEQMKDKGPFSKEYVLSSTQWMKDNNNGWGKTPATVLLECTSRDAPLHSEGRRGLAGGYEVFCRKTLVDGAEMWVVDVEWWRYSPDRNAGESRGALCDCCERVCVFSFILLCLLIPF